jgi:hypothetical protein
MPEDGTFKGAAARAEAEKATRAAEHKQKLAAEQGAKQVVFQKGRDWLEENLVPLLRKAARELEPNGYELTWTNNFSGVPGGPPQIHFTLKKGVKRLRQPIVVWVEQNRYNAAVGSARGGGPIPVDLPIALELYAEANLTAVIECAIKLFVDQ